MTEDRGYSEEVILHCLLPEKSNWRSSRHEYHRYIIQAFGLTERDVEMFLACKNGNF